MNTEPYPIHPYADWSQEQHQRWLNAGNTFGAHLLQYVRDNAVRQAVAETSDDAEQVKRVVDLALRAVMDFLDGYYHPEIDANHRAEYVLLVRIRDADNKVVETVELAPEGDGLAMGYAGWDKNDFGQQP